MNTGDLKSFSGFKYKTRGDASPKGRSRVFFCCRDEDHDRYFEAISNEILNIAKDAAIWYHDPADPEPEGEDYSADLGNMQLFVIPISAAFLREENRARSVEFKFAMDHHIPVLPLMQEPGLEQDFNRICGDLQFLYKYENARDLTAVPYEEKLKKFLDSVLISADLSSKIRAAFDAYIFLSYRKKDRKYADEIMRLIHADPYCRDVAIWYDEFLTPGENFNDAIIEAMEKSSVFALVVTPNLLQDPNYVMTTEYPAAKKMQLPLLPIEADDTDKKLLASLYEGLEQIYPKDRIGELIKDMLRNIAIHTNDSDPVHNFFIGLAYLSGIDVEKDADRAVELISMAADRGLPEAFEKLESMYRTGDGVPRDFKKSLEWQKKFLERLKYRAKAHPNSLEYNDRYFHGLWDLSDSLRSMGRTKEIEEICHAMLDQINILEGLGSADADRYRGICYGKLGNCSAAEGHRQEALEWEIKASDSFAKAAKAKQTGAALKDLASIYNNIGLSFRDMGDDTSAQKYFEQSYGIYSDIPEKDRDVSIKRSLFMECNNLGNLLYRRGRISEAASWYLKGHGCIESLATESYSLEDRGYLASSYANLSNISKDRGHLEEARKHAEKALRLRLELAEESGLPEARFHLSKSFGMLAELERDSGDLKQEETDLRKETDILLALAAENSSPEVLDALMINYTALGRCYFAMGDDLKAAEYMEKAISLYEQDTDAAYGMHSMSALCFSMRIIGQIKEDEGDTEGAECWYRRSASFGKKTLNGPVSPDLSRAIGLSFSKLGAFLVKKYELLRNEILKDEALECYENALMRFDANAEQRNSATDWDDVVLTCYTIGKKTCFSDPVRIEKLGRAYELGDELYKKRGNELYLKISKDSEAIVERLLEPENKGLGQRLKGLFKKKDRN